MDGEVNAVVTGGPNNTYLGGDFEGPTWDINDSIADIDTRGMRHQLTQAMNATGPVDIRCVEMDTAGNLYVGGVFDFTIPHPTQSLTQITNIAKMKPTGQWDPTFHVRTNGPVNAIAVQEKALGGHVVEWIYFGGEFTRLMRPVSPTGHILVQKIARVPASGDPWALKNGTAEAQAIRVWSSPSTSGTLQMDEQANQAVVHALAFHRHGPTQVSGDVLVIGGEKIFSVRINGTLTDTGTDWEDTGTPRRIANLAFVDTLGGITYVNDNTNRPPDLAPRVLSSNIDDPQTNTAVVRTISVAYDLEFTDDPYGGLPTPLHMQAQAVAFGGEFSHVLYDTSQDPLLESSNVGLTNLIGSRPSVIPGDLPNDSAEAWSIAFDDSNRLWVARDAQQAPIYSVDSIWVYDIDVNQSSSGLNTDPRFDRYADFDFGPDGPVYELAHNWIDNTMVAAGSFSSRPARLPAGGSPGWVEQDIPAHNITAYSTDTFPVGITEWDSLQPGAFGAYIPDFRASAPTLNASSNMDVHIAVGQLGLDRYVIAGTGLSEITAERSNLAAIGPYGNLLDWGPRTTGPVHAMTVDPSTTTPTLYFAGEGGVYGHSFVGTVVSAAPADDDSTLPLDWWTWTTGGSGAGPVAKTLAVSGSSLVIGGDFDALAGDPKSSVGAVALYDPGTVQGGQSALSWAPALQGPGGSDPIVHTILSDPQTGDLLIGGDLDVNNVHGLLRVEPPGVGDTINADGFGLFSGDVVHDLAWTAGGELVIVGDLTVHRPGFGPVHTLVALFDPSSSSITASQEGVSGATTYAVVVDPLTDNIIIGGDFVFVGDGPQNLVQRKGMAAYDSSLNLLSWQEDLIVSSGEEVRTMSIGLGPNGGGFASLGLWVGGSYTGGSPTYGGEKIGFYTPLP